MKHLFDNIFVCGQLNEADFKGLKESGITTIINNRPDDEEPGQLNSERAAQLAQGLDMAYHYLPMVNGQTMPDNLINDFKSIIDQAEGNILAHCRSGMRSSFIWALGQIPTGAISVDQAIDSAVAAGIPLNNARAVLESVQPNS